MNTNEKLSKIDENKLKLGIQIIKRRYHGLYNLLESMVSKNNLLLL